MPENKLIYILNEYSSNSVQHFYHIINLLEKIAEKNVKIALIIEKCVQPPNVQNENIKIYTQKHKAGSKRAIELFSILKTLMKDGYRKVFVRISMNAAIIAILAAKLYHGRTYYWQSGTTISLERGYSGMKKIKWFFNIYSRMIFIKIFIDYFVTGPETMVQYYIEELNISKKKMLLMYNDIDISRFNERETASVKNIKKKLGLPKDAFIVLFVHSFSPVRRNCLYIPAIIEDKAFIEQKGYLVIIGSGPEENQVKKQIACSDYKDHILFLGSIPNSNIQDYYAGADMFVNPSYTEGFPRVVIEAMACGLPVVATDAGGTKDLFGSLQSQYVIDKDNVGLFRDKLIELMKNEEMRKAISTENLQTVQRFSTENVRDMYISNIFGEPSS